MDKVNHTVDLKFLATTSYNNGQKPLVPVCHRSEQVKERENDSMDFTLNEEQLAIRDTCREFAEQEIKPLAEEMDRTGEFPYGLIRKMGELGLLGLPFSEEY